VTDKSARELIECAQFGYQIAPERCARGTMTEDDCAWYHGTWPWLRVLGIGTSAAVHSPYFEAATRSSVAAGECRRVLVSGTADFALPATVARAGGDALEYVIVDRCETPLQICRWYADRHALRFETECVDILDYQARTRFDLIYAHAFLGYFDGAGRSDLFRKWSSLLRPGGRMVMVQRLRPDADSPIVRFSAEQTADLVNLVRRNATRIQAQLRIAPAELAVAAARYCARFQSHVVSSRAELEGLFTGAGFRVEDFTLGGVSQQRAATLKGPTIPTAGEFASVTAVLAG
jgi:SAM-dependent methyltransferase